MASSAWWRGGGHLTRLEYFAWGTALVLIKLLIDYPVAAALSLLWEWEDYLGLRSYQSLLQEPGQVARWVMLLIALPFAWLGVTATLRRLRDACLPLWLVALFFVPAVKFVLFAVLCVIPSRHQSEPPLPKARIREGWFSRLIPAGRAGSALLALVITSAITVVQLAVATKLFESYSWTTFVGAPFCFGLMSALIYGYHEMRTAWQCFGVVTLGLFFVAVILLMVALEGVLCIAMAAPIAWVLGGIGSYVGCEIMWHTRWRQASSEMFCVLFLAVPFSLGVEHFAPRPAPQFPVSTSVEIGAPPTVVWQNVVSFSDLPPPKESLFRLGIAYPQKACIYGTGVGAVRHCIFSTGPFVEPIEVWDEPNLLRFSVTSNPSPMQEISPYAALHPPHLDGFLVSRQGQFRLIALPDGGTRLEGTTWYEHNLWPASYWKLWSDHIIHKIHLRVLNHIKTLAEAER